MFEFFMPAIAKQNTSKTAVILDIVDILLCNADRKPLCWSAVAASEGYKRVLKRSNTSTGMQKVSLWTWQDPCCRWRMCQKLHFCKCFCFGGVMFLEAMTYWDGRVLRYHVKAVVVMWFHVMVWISESFRWKHGSLGVLRPASAEAAATCPCKNAKKWNGRSNIHLYIYILQMDWYKYHT